MGKQTNEWMDMQYMCIDMQETIIFQWILRFLQKHYGRTDQQTDQQTDQRTDKPSYRDAIAASKKTHFSRHPQKVFKIMSWQS